MLLEQTAGVDRFVNEEAVLMVNVGPETIWVEDEERDEPIENADERVVAQVPIVDGHCLQQILADVGTEPGPHCSTLRAQFTS